MPAPLPSSDHLPHRWRVSDARLVLAALASSGLTAAEFSRRTGIPPNRLSRWGTRLNAPDPGHRGPGRPRALEQAARLVELVPVLPVAGVQAPVAASLLAVEVRTPGGWQLRVPGELLGELVGVLAARSC